MSGYTPVFDSVFHGTLCGQWPTLPVWLTILPLADKNGHIDMTYQAIAALTGWPLDLLKQAIGTLTEPDPDSRSAEEGGRRLVLLDPTNRQWGWRVVNHGQYREKARKQMQQIAATESGRDAERKRIERERQRLAAHTPPMSSDVQSRPALSSADRLSDSDSDSDKESKIGQMPSAFDRFWSAYPRKRKRKAAEEIWKRKRLDAKAEALLADILERSKSDRRWLEGFIPDPTTYLNGERWTDERETAKRFEAPRRLPPDAFEVARRGS